MPKSKESTITDTKKNLSDYSDNNSIHLVTNRNEPTALVVNFGELSENDARKIKSLFDYNPVGSVHKALELI